MSRYKEELDYSDDPMEGIEIWGDSLCDDVAAMVDGDLVPSPHRTEQSLQVTPAIYSDHIINQLDSLSFSIPSPSVLHLWELQT